MKHICLVTFYSSSAKALCQFPEFQEFVPGEAVTFIGAIVNHLRLESNLDLTISTQVHGVLNTYQIHSFDNGEQLNIDVLESTYWKIITKIQQVIVDKYHGAKLKVAVTDWARTGM